MKKTKNDMVDLQMEKYRADKELRQQLAVLGAVAVIATILYFMFAYSQKGDSYVDDYGRSKGIVNQG